MKKYKYEELRLTQEVVNGARTDAIEQFFVAQTETNVSKQLRCCDLVAACDGVLKVLKNVSRVSVTTQLNS